MHKLPFLVLLALIYLLVNVLLFCSTSVALSTVFSWYFSLQQQKKYQKIKSSSIVVQSFIRGWKVGIKLCIILCFSSVNSGHHVSENCAITPFPSSLCLSQARKLLRELKYQKRCKEAVTTIAAYWHGTQVLSRIWKKKLITKGNHQLGKHLIFRSTSTKRHWLMPTHYTVGFESSATAFPS